MITSLLVGLGKILSGAQVRGHVPSSQLPQRVYFGNHTSHLDFIVLWAALPPRVRELTRPVAGGDYWDRDPVRRFLARNTFKAILIERGSGAKADRAEAVACAQREIQKIADGMGTTHSIIVFPEGTRGDGKRILPFKSGLYHLCRMKPELDLIPAYLENMHRILPKGRTLPVPMLGKITFGRPMRIAAGETKESFLERTRAALVDLKSDP